MDGHDTAQDPKAAIEAAGNPMAAYLTGTSAWFAAFGIQMVLFGYLTATVLKLPPVLVAIAQASVQLPTLVLLLFGGSVADLIDMRRVMLSAHLAALLPPLMLGIVVAADALTLSWLIAFGVSMGVITSFMMPAREAMLARVIDQNDQKQVQSAVRLSLLTQFSTQLLGMFAARLAAFVGVPALCAVFALLQAAGAASVMRLPAVPPMQPANGAPRASHVSRILVGLREVRASASLLPITIITFSIGMFFVGSFLVQLPITLREEFGGNVQQFSTMQVSFWGGTILSTLVLGRFGFVARKGRLIVFALASGVIILALLAIPGPLWLLYAEVFCWGLGAGVTISMTRTIVQEDAPAASRARIMSIYQLGFTGGMPIGALIMGPLVALFGHRNAALIPAGAMALMVIVLLWRTQIWSQTSRATP